MLLILINYWFIIRREFVNKVLLVPTDIIPELKRVSCLHRTSTGNSRRAAKTVVLAKLIFELLLCYNIVIAKFSSVHGYYNNTSRRLIRESVNQKSIQYTSIFGTITHPYKIASLVANITWFFNFHMSLFTYTPVVATAKSSGDNKRTNYRRIEDMVINFNEFDDTININKKENRKLLSTKNRLILSKKKISEEVRSSVGNLSPFKISETGLKFELLKGGLLRTAVKTAVNPLEGKKKDYVPFLSLVEDALNFKLRANIFYFSLKPYFRAEQFTFKKYFIIDFEFAVLKTGLVSVKQTLINNILLFTALKMGWLWIDAGLIKRYSFNLKV